MGYVYVMNSYGMICYQEKFNFRSPNLNFYDGIYACGVDSSGDVYGYIYFWNVTNSYGLIISPHLDYINDYYHYAHHATSDGEVGYVDGKNGNAKYSYGKLSGIQFWKY